MARMKNKTVHLLVAKRDVQGDIIINRTAKLNAFVEP